MATVIKVSGLGKKYTIRHLRGETFPTLRDSISRQVKRWFRAGRVEKEKGRAKEEIWALKDISFEVKAGEKLGIIGRNGAGKTTLLKIFSRITQPTTGTVEINGRVASLLEVGTGFHPELTGRENIFLNGSILGMNRKEIKDKFTEIVSFAGVEKFLDTPVKRYSSGMYVRLAFSVAAHLESDILLIDEVLAVGDLEFQEKCLGKMEEVTHGGRTVLFVSHNMTAVGSLCSRALFINNGGLEFAGNTDEVINKYISFNQKTLDNVVNLKDALRSLGDQKAIYEAWIENESNEVVSNVLMGSRIFICFRFKANRKLRNPGFGFGIENIFGQRIFTFGNYIFRKKIFADVSAGTVKCEIPELLLLPGNYLVSFGLAERNDISIDYIERALNFTVVENDVFGTGKMYGKSHGFVYLRGNISLQQ